MHSIYNEIDGSIRLKSHNVNTSINPSLIRMETVESDSSQSD